MEIWVVSSNLKNKTASYLTIKKKKNGLIQDYSGSTELQFGTSKIDLWQKQASPEMEGEECSFTQGRGEVGRSVINEKSIGVNWGFKA